MTSYREYLPLWTPSMHSLRVYALSSRMGGGRAGSGCFGRRLNVGETARCYILNELCHNLQLCCAMFERATPCLAVSQHRITVRMVVLALDGAHVDLVFRHDLQKVGSSLLRSAKTTTQLRFV
jgi:hypothetical protein